MLPNAAYTSATFALDAADGGSGYSADWLAYSFLAPPGGATINIRQALRALLAESAGNVTGAPTAPEFWSLDGTRVRIAGTATPAGNRTRSLLDLS